MIRSLLTLLLLFAATARAQDYGTDHRLKIEVAGQRRKGVLFLPRSARKHQILPLLVAIPDTRGKAMLEVGQWQKPAYDMHFAVFSVDVVTSLQRGWMPSELLEMQHDMEAVTEGMKIAIDTARREGVGIDRSAIVITGFSGGTYLTLWMGLRRPDLFLGVCGRACVFFREEVEFSELEKFTPDHDQRIFVYRGESDAPRVRKNTDLARDLLRKAGYRHVDYAVIPGMQHESKPEVFLRWYAELLRTTARGRAESARIRAELEKLAPAVEHARSGAYGKLLKLVARERKAGFRAGAKALLDKVRAKGEKELARAADLEADGKLFAAAKLLKSVERTYVGLEVSKQALQRRKALLRSDAYKAAGMLVEAKKLLQKDREKKAFGLLDKLVAKYPETPAAEEAQRLLER